MRSLKTFKKAITAALAAAGSWYSLVAIDGTITNTEWVQLPLLVLTAGLAVWLIPNEG